MFPKASLTPQNFQSKHLKIKLAVWVMGQVS